MESAGNKTVRYELFISIFVEPCFQLYSHAESEQEVLEQARVMQELLSEAGGKVKVEIIKHTSVCSHGEEYFTAEELTKTSVQEQHRKSWRAM